MLENIPTMYIVLSYVISNLLTAKVEFLQQGRTINHATSLSAIYVGLLYIVQVLVVKQVCHLVNAIISKNCQARVLVLVWSSQNSHSKKGPELTL